MIECIICKKSKNESEFPYIRSGGLAICFLCKETKEAKEFQEKAKAAAELEWQKRIEYDEKKRKNIASQIYEGQYDWM